MKNIINISLSILFLFSCNNAIKNESAKIEIEKGTKIIIKKTKTEIIESELKVEVENKNPFIGFWVGYFEKDDKSVSNKSLYVDEGYYWDRENKINISIDEITDSIVIGHSVVAGNDRPFSGKVVNNTFKVKEPGDHKYDGEFIFEINDKLKGKWQAYKDIDIKYRIYTLEKKTFSYDSDIMLEKSKSYLNWNKFKEKKTEWQMDGEIEEWISKEFATATDLIYTINASKTLLKKQDVENLQKGDLTIIRNTIYARHGYSFKNRPLRVFFDAQSWYIPIHVDIKSDFTEIEKQNIKLLLKYEKNASEYYDFFGRG